MGVMDWTVEKIYNLFNGSPKLTGVPENCSTMNPLAAATQGVQTFNTAALQNSGQDLGAAAAYTDEGIISSNRPVMLGITTPGCVSSSKGGGKPR